MRTLTRIFEFDSAHRVMNENVKCFNLHGHRFKVEAVFSYEEKGSLGYAIDFKEIKRICGDFIDTFLDHANILNPKDEGLIKMGLQNKWNTWIMGFGRDEDINPSAENIASEIFECFNFLVTEESHGVRLSKIRLYETPNCWVDVDSSDYPMDDWTTSQLKEFRDSKGVMNYDCRKD